MVMVGADEKQLAFLHSHKIWKAFRANKIDHRRTSWESVTQDAGICALKTSPHVAVRHA
jgi:hypothetical protein